MLRPCSGRVNGQVGLVAAEWQSLGRQEVVLTNVCACLETRPVKLNPRHLDASWPVGMRVGKQREPALSGWNGHIRVCPTVLRLASLAKFVWVDCGYVCMRESP